MLPAQHLRSALTPGFWICLMKDRVEFVFLISSTQTLMGRARIEETPQRRKTLYSRPTTGCAVRRSLD